MTGTKILNCFSKPRISALNPILFVVATGLLPAAPGLHKTCVKSEKSSFKTLDRQQKVDVRAVRVPGSSLRLVE